MLITEDFADGMPSIHLEEGETFDLSKQREYLIYRLRQALDYKEPQHLIGLIAEIQLAEDIGADEVVAATDDGPESGFRYFKELCRVNWELQKEGFKSVFHFWNSRTSNYWGGLPQSWLKWLGPEKALAN